MLELFKEDLGTRETARANAQAGETIMNIAISKIIIREGFNVREEFGDIEELAKSMLKNGQTVPARVDVLVNGTFALVDGNRRYLALKWLFENGEAEPKLKAIVNTKVTTEEERLLQMFTTQDNKQLEPFEVASYIKRFINIGYSQKDVANAIAKTPAYISQMLSFERESFETKKLVKEGKITVSAVLAAQKKIPNSKKRAEEIGKAVDNSIYGKKITINEIGGKAIRAIDLFKNELNSKILVGRLADCDDRYNEAVIEVIELLEKYKL